MSAKLSAIVLGIIVIIAGLLGFVSNPLIGTSGLFMTNGGMDVVYIIIGLVLLAVGIWASMQSGLWLKIGGVIYLIIGVLGLFMGPLVLGFLAGNGATTWLNIIIGLVMLAAGIWGKGESMGMPSSMPMQGGAM